MEINAEKIIVTLDNQEARDLAYRIKYSLEASIKKHFIHLQDYYGRGLEGEIKPEFEKQCRKAMNMMNNLISCASGDKGYLEEELWHFLESEYNKLGDMKPITKKEL